jgi:MFS family permease
MLVVHMKQSQVLLLFWLTFALVVNGTIGNRYGIPYLFLDPEYRGVVDFWSFGLLGVGFGLFAMTFHIASYLYYSRNFPFLATLSRSLYRFSINNSVIPGLFIALYIYRLTEFQLVDEEATISQIVQYIAAFLTGGALTISIVMTYFFSVNRDITSFLGQNVQKQIGKIVKETRNPEDIQDDDDRIRYYWKNFFQLRIVRQTNHYSPIILLKVLQRHHLNASFFFILIIGLLFALNYYRDLPLLALPAGASLFMMASFFILLSAVLFSWLKSWFATGIIIILLLGNQIVSIGWLQKQHYAFGLNYNVEKVDYNLPSIQRIMTDSILEADRNTHYEMLLSWKKRQNKRKPVLVLVNVSGGGLRSAVFTYRVLQELEERTKGQIGTQTRMITGASGGMLGAAFYRELLIRNPESLRNDSLAEVQAEIISKDILNSVGTSLVVGDLFFNPFKFEYNGYKYPKDRGYAFETALHNNTANILDRKLSYYTDLEQGAYIPSIVFSPTVVNDGRRMVISSVPMSFMCLSGAHPNKPEDIDGIEFMRFFEDQDAEDLRYSSAIRMSATFPYITPLVRLPSNPTIETIDAGARDNNGFELSVRYLYQFKDWINRNTSGVVIIQINSDQLRSEELSEPFNPTIFHNLTRPISGVIASFGQMQEFNQAQLTTFTNEWMRVPVEKIDFNLFSTDESVALNWHLTGKDKQKIREALLLDSNERAFNRVVNLIE